MKIFLGYPSENEEIAWKVYDFLKASGDDVWFDKVSLVAGTDWDRERESGQRAAELIVHLCSEAINRRAGVVNREINQTLRLVDDQPLGSLYVIPIRLDGVKLPVEMTRFQYFDFADGWEKKLSEGVEKRRSQLTGTSPQKPPADRVEPTEKILSQVQKIDFSDVTDKYECRGEYLSYGESGLYWKLVNSEIAAASLTSFYSTRHDFLTSYGNGELREDSWKHEWSISAEEFFRQEEVISVRFYTFIGFSGAAHPSHFITTKNFLGVDGGGAIDIKNLLDHSEENSKRILDYCEDVIVAQFSGELDKSAFFGIYRESSETIWKLLAQFNLDQRGITINFSPYDVLPYVFGSHEILVPWRMCEEMISDQYRSTIKKIIKGAGPLA